MNNSEWWIDGSLGIDSAGNLYATWDIQSGGHDTGWLTYSASRGRTWSRLSIGKGWLTKLIRASPEFGNWRVWPGDTIGLSLYPGASPGSRRVAVSWGSALGGRRRTRRSGPRSSARCRSRPRGRPAGLPGLKAAGRSPSPA